MRWGLEEVHRAIVEGDVHFGMDSSTGGKSGGQLRDIYTHMTVTRLVFSIITQILIFFK